MNNPAERSWGSFGLTEIFALVCIVGVFAWCSIPNFNSGGHSSPHNACINNLRQIDGAINEWALEKNKTTNDTPTWDDVKVFIKSNPQINLLKCPAGGTYTLHKVGTIPQVSCSLSAATPPHRLP